MLRAQKYGSQENSTIEDGRRHNTKPEFVCVCVCVGCKGGSCQCGLWQR